MQVQDSLPTDQDASRSSQEAQEGTYQPDPLPPYRVERPPASLPVQSVLEPIRACGLAPLEAYADINREDWFGEEFLPKLNEPLIGLTDKDNPDHLDEWAILKAIYGPLDLFKCKLSKSTMRRYQHWLTVRKSHVDRIPRGAKHYNYQRKRYRLGNYKRYKVLMETQAKYRGTIHGLYIYKRKIAKSRKEIWNLAEDEFSNLLVSLGNYPGTDIPYWKLFSQKQADGLQIRRTDTSLGWRLDNLEARYKGKVIALGKDLLYNKVEIVG